MKIYINKYFKEIHWSAYAAAVLCFITTFFTFKEYKESKFLFEKGDIEKAIVVKLPKNCYYSSRIKNYLELNIIAKGRIEELQIDNKMCDTIQLNDTILVRCCDKFKRILKYDSFDLKVPKINLYFSIFASPRAQDGILIPLYKIFIQA